MKYLIDFNIVNALYDDKSVFHTKIVEKFNSLSDEDKVYVSVLTLFEFEYSFYCCVDDFKKDYIRTVISKINSNFDIINVSKKDADTFGKIKSLIKNTTGTSAKNMKAFNIDIIIASSAISSSFIIVSGDKIFKTISNLHPQLNSENWLID